MIDLNQYKELLSINGVSVANVKRLQSDRNINEGFTKDPTYKKVYLLTKNGWEWVDAKYQFHTAPTIAKDAVDYYLQFRPKVHYPIGSYVIVPDDTSPDINLNEEEIQNPFLQPISNRTQWWIIVGRDEANAYVRYMILKCDWDFKWIYNGQIMSCWGCSKGTNSVTNGIGRAQYSQSPDSLSSAWVPDTFHVYGDSLVNLGLCDTRTIMHEQRFFFSNNALDPKIYQVTKITDLNPQGVIKLSIQQDELHPIRDNKDLCICDYFTSEGEVIVDKVTPPEPDITKTSIINTMSINEYGELVPNTENNSALELGKTSYFAAVFSNENINAQWRITLNDEENQYSEEDKLYYTGLIKFTQVDNTTIGLKPAKANSLIGKTFTLSVSDEYGEYNSSIIMEVSYEA